MILSVLSKKKKTRSRSLRIKSDLDKKNTSEKKSGERALLEQSALSPEKSVTGEQTAKDADSPAQKKETNREQQERLAGDGRTDCNDLGKNSRDNSAELGKQGLHSGGSISS